MKQLRLFVLLPLAALSLLIPSCAKTSGQGEGAGGSGGEGGGDAQCKDKPCGTPCEVCDEPPCNQICDGNGECRSDYKVTCSLCPDGEHDSPSDGDDCPAVGLVCEYRDANVEDQFADCHSREVCTVNGWENQPDDDANECYYWDPDATCPMVMPTHGASCIDSAADYTDLCAYGTGTFCVCTKCLGDPTCQSSYTWACVGPPGEPCPTEAPLLGHACTDEGLRCPYGADWLEEENDGGAMLLNACRVCEGGIWVARETVAECYQ